MTDNATIYLPPAGDRPAEPAPFVMTDADVIRLCRWDIADPYQALGRYRRRGFLTGTKIGNDVRYLLPDVLAFLQRLKEEDAR